MLIDDRKITSPSLDDECHSQLDNMVNYPKTAKMQLFQYTAAGQRAISEAGYSEFATTLAVILGAAFAGRKTRKLVDFETKRVSKAERQTALRCKFCPFPNTIA